MDFLDDPQDGTGAPVASAEEYRAAWRQDKDADLEKQKKEKKGDASKTATSTDDSFGKKVSRFFESLPSLKDTGRAVVRGAAEALNNQGKTLNDIAVGIGAMKPETAKPHGKDASFIEWFSKPASEEAIDATLGKRQDGIAGFVESVSQFATGMVGASKFVKPLGLAKTAASTVAGGVADLSAFDPYQKRLSNLIQSGPSWMANPLTELLQAKDDDSAIVARLKQGAEGLITGYTVDRIVAGVRALRGAGKGEVKALEAPKPTEPVVVKKVDDAFVVAKSEDEQLADNIAFASEAEAEGVASSMNYAIKIAKQPAGKLSEEQVSQVQDVAKRLTEGPHVAEDAQRMLDGVDLNFNYSQAPQDAKAVINAISEALPEPTTFMRSTGENGQTHAETVKLADGLLADMDGDQVVEAISNAFNTTEKLPQLITAARTYMYGVGKQIAQLSRAADAQPDNAVAFGELKKAMEHLWDVHAHLAGTSSNVGRALEAHKIKVGMIDEALEDGTGQVVAAESHRLASDGALDGLTKQELRALARTAVMDEGDPSAILAAMKGQKALNKGPVDQSLVEKVIGYRIEAMLSGPKTQIVNAVNNTITALQMPAEYWWAGVRSNNPALRQQGADQISGLFLEARDAWRAAAKAFRTGTNALDDAGNIVADAQLAQQTPSLLNGLAKLAHLPSRMLLTTDEFFKTLNYRSNVRAQSLRLAREQGITDAGQLAQRVADDMKAAFALDGSATRPVALQYARTATFQNPLEYGRGKWLQEGVQESPMLRMIMPFVRTPVNIFRYAWQRTPVLNRWQKQFAEEMKAGGERAAIAQAKTEMGMLTYTTAAALAASGEITGSGPKNKQIRRQWMAAGNQPYSIKVPGVGWVSYRRADPALTPMGIIADIADFVHASGEVSVDEADEMAAAFAAAVASNVTSKTFMQGLTETLDAISSREPFSMMKLLGNTAGSFIPNALRQMNPDDTVRETRGMLEEIQGRIPGWSEGLEPRRNILGEPILRPPGYLNRTLNPFTIMSDPGDHDIQDQLVELGKSMAVPDSKRGQSNKIDMADRKLFDNGTGQSPYDRMLELVGTARDGNPNLRTELTEKMKSEDWKNASDGTEAIPGGKKYLMASRIITKHQDRAFNQVLKEYPKLAAALKQDKAMSRAAIRGGESAVDSAARMFNPQ